jgi:uncharacterized phage-associated protein
LKEEDEATMANVLDVADAVQHELSHLNLDESPTSWKLQKLVYYVQVWTLKETGEPMFDEEIQAWKDGPVVPKLFKKHMGFRIVSKMKFGDRGRLSDLDNGLVSRVVGVYGVLTGDQLSAISHKEAPWLNARVGFGPEESSKVVLDLEVMRSSYDLETATPNEAVELAIGSSRLEGLETPEHIRLVLEEVVSGRLSVDEAIRRRISQI